MRLVVLVVLLAVWCGCGSCQHSGGGLIAPGLGVNPVPPETDPVLDALPEGCFCLPINQRCPFSQFVVRIINRPGEKLCPDQKFCCPPGIDPNDPNVPIVPAPGTGQPTVPRDPTIPREFLVGTCGIQNPQPIPPVADSEANFAEYPWIAALLAQDGSYLAGGVLISSNWVLTAAHKVNDLSPNSFKVRLGELDLSRLNENPRLPHIDVGVSRVVIHPQFNSKNLRNDLALLQLSNPVDTNRSPHIARACLPEQGQIFDGKSQCWVTGWGSNDFASVQQILKEVDVPVVDPFACQEKLRRTELGQGFLLDQDSFLCAGGVAGKDACSGDGGSPLVCHEPNRGFIVVGLVAWGVGCAKGDVPGVYVNIPNNINFIYDVVSRAQG